MLSIPVRLEILINLSIVPYFQRDTGNGFVYVCCQNFSSWRCINKNDIVCSSLLWLVCFMTTRKKRKIYWEKIARFCPESRGGLYLWTRL